MRACVLTAVFVLATLVGCGGETEQSEQPGKEGGACLKGGLCEGSLVCIDEVCRKTSDDVTTDGCLPDCEGRVCGDDGCGGSCGSCETGITCSDQGQCGCTPSCDGKACGDDGCGGDCGQCFVGEVCQGGTCECEPQCGGKECGDDQCGGSCGECENGVCREDGTCCHPFCEDRVCGADGCGGSCGECEQGLNCYDGVCDCRPASEAGSEIPDPNGEGLTWVKIKAGCFDMGCEGDAPFCLDDEKPKHRKQVAAFQILKTEVTRTQYQAVMGKDTGIPAGCMECPVAALTYEDAKAFCEALGARLPTEAEWEYAARGGELTAFPCGEDAGCVDAVAWYAENSESKLQSVAQKQPNAYGLYDMLGNAWERVEDCYHTSFELAPQEAFPAWLEACDLDHRVARGGSATDTGSDLHVTRRLNVENTLAGGMFGVRCAR